MPNIKSAIKRMRQNATNQQRNLRTKRLMRSNIRILVEALGANNKTAAADALKKAQSELDKAVKHGVIHKNKAARQKARLAKQVNAVVGKTAKPAAKKAATKTTAKKAAPKTAAKKAPAKKPAAKKAGN